MCQAFKVTSSGYYSWRNASPSNRTTENMKLLKRIEEIHNQSDQTYGSPRITEVLLDEGYAVSRPRVARLMRKHGIRAKTRRKFKATTDSEHSYPISPNRLKQNFSACFFGEIWTSDITYVQTAEGWLYLTVIMDLFNREIVGWSMSHSLRTVDTTIPALHDACKRYHAAPGLIFHSDRGVQYACNDFRERLSKQQMIQSMSGTGNCYDNAVTESFFSSLKKDLIYHRSYKTRGEARQSIFQYIEVFYNRVRKHSTLGYLSPIQFRQLKKAA